MTEVLLTTPAGRSFGARTTALIAPGVTYAGEGWEFLIEALVPATRATGSGAGVRAQLHLALDYLFPTRSVGRCLRATLTRSGDARPRHECWPGCGDCGLALIVAALVLLSGRAALAQPAGTVIGVSGDCFVVSGGGRAAAQARPGGAGRRHSRCCRRRRS